MFSLLWKTLALACLIIRFLRGLQDGASTAHVELIVQFYEYVSVSFNE